MSARSERSPVRAMGGDGATARVPAGTSTAGTSTAGTSAAGTSAAGTSAAGTSAAGTSAAHTLPPLGDGLRIHHGALRRGRRIALREGTLRAPGGVVVGLVGENGAGKTTLLLSAAGVLLGDAPRGAGGGAGGGATTVTLDGGEVRAVAYLPQRPALPPWLTVRRSAALHGASAALLGEAAARLGMTPLLDRRPGELSGGQLQALAAAIALARPEPVLLLDEPFGAVDLARRPVLRQLVTERAARVPRGVVVLSSHVAADLAALCDWVVVLRDGGYAWQGTTWALVHGTEAGGASVQENGGNDRNDRNDGNGADALERAVAALLAPGVRPGACGHSPR